MSIPFTKDPIQGTLDCLVAQGHFSQAQADELAQAATTLVSMGMSPNAALSMAISMGTLRATGGGSTAPNDPGKFAGNLNNEGVPASAIFIEDFTLNSSSPTHAWYPRPNTVGLISIYDKFLSGPEVLTLFKVHNTFGPVAFNEDDQVPIENGLALITWPDNYIYLQLLNYDAMTDIGVRVSYIPDVP